MKKYIHIALIFSLAFLMSNCGGGSSDEPSPAGPDQPLIPQEPENGEHPMGFSPFESPQSRVSTPLQDKHSLFKVWAFKHTSASTLQTVIPGYKVKYLGDDTRWQYDGTSFISEEELANQYLKFWDASSESYDFCAYAPLEIPSGVTLTEDPDAGFTISGISAHNEESYNFLIAKQVRYLGGNEGLKDIDALTGIQNESQPQMYHSTVPLVFHHILARVEYRIYNTGTKTAEIDGIFVNFDEGETLNTAGDLVNGVWNNFSSTANMLMSKTYLDPNLLKLPPIEQEEYKTKSESLITYYEIPQTLNQYVNVSVGVNGENISKRFEIGDKDWKFDSYYVYYIHLEVNDSGGTPILIGLTVEDFEPDDPINEEQTNW